MVQVETREQYIEELDDNSFAKLHDWFIEFEQTRWEKKIGQDFNAGKLDFLINAALAKYHAGTTRSLGFGLALIQNMTNYSPKVL